MTDQAVASPVDAERVIKAYLALREKRSELKRKYETIDDGLKEKMDKLTGWLAQTMQTTGLTQVGTGDATAYRQLKVKPSCADWGVFWPWAAENGRLDMLEKRLSANTIKTYYEETSELPPGVNIIQEYEVVVRKK